MQRVMNSLRTALLCGSALVAVSGGVYAADMSLKDDPVIEEARQIGISVSIAATTDYVFRGLSQTAEDPTAQASVDLTYGSLYLGVWGSGIDFGPGTTHEVEIDIYGGWKPTWNSVTFDLGFIYYYYPGANDKAAETDYVEAKLGASAAVWEGLTVGATVYYSPDFSFETGEAWTVEGSVSKALPKIMGLDLTASALLGYTDVEDLGDYTYWNIGITKTFSKFSLDVRYWDTDLDEGNNNFGCEGPDGLFSCSERVVGTVKVTLP